MYLTSQSERNKLVVVVIILIKALVFLTLLRHFFIIQTLKGYGKVAFQIDSRLSILHTLIQAAPVVTNSPESAALLKAMCFLAFCAHLRVAEITVVLSNKADVPLQLAQLTFGNYKHSYNRPTFF